ncbi:class I SAM-dependent methyltransferase [Oceanirhabdus seepicola]|uniref:Methyltransferase domain-containing protein n=1 Tax=Oceanirhabdus seepicola TaxID=2828781 RepID=A0A9J6P9M3_9CLOT|nr:methyltransferase domain-containing protein [Oceanirhabdus seepicola]MCM1992141.1 methyltransferase domain-containing protein [Oceanirhabdus seepicola]
MKEHNINNNIDLIKLINDISTKPKLYTPSDDKFWDDDYISTQMLTAHLNPNIDAASRNFRTIDRITNHLITYFNINENINLLDIGCGPGLYCEKFAQSGANVTGIDLSKTSITHAINSAKENCLHIKYINDSYLEMNSHEDFDIITLIYYDFGSHYKNNQELIIKNVYNALKPNGYFVFDVLTINFKNKRNIQNNWNSFNGGFWNKSSHTVLSKTFYYEDETTFLDQYTVITKDDTKTYRIYEKLFTLNELEEMLNKYGLKIVEKWADLDGTPYDENSTSLGLVVQKL